MMSNSSIVKRNIKVLCLLIIFTFLNQSTNADDFDGCDNTFNLNVGVSHLKSPNYPNSYPRGSSCRYKFIAPIDHDITVNCTINSDKGANGCSTERFYLARDGDVSLQDAEQLCGYGTVIRKTLFRSLVLAYTSGGSWGAFNCHLHVQRQPCDCGWSISSKISNGEEASINEYPSIVALKDRTSENLIYCSAAIISHRYLLTAAHCAKFQPNANYIEARVGRHNLQSAMDTKYAAVYYIKRIIVHPGYTPEPTLNDIAILETTKDIEYSRGVGPICLPPLSQANNAFSYNLVDVIGWGSTKFAHDISPTLQKINVLITDNNTCKKVYENVKISPTQICTYDYMGTHKDSCQYDSGGPVIYKPNRQFLLGIISYGKGCGVDVYSTGINTRITSYLNWIYQNTGYSTCNVSM